MPPTASSTTVKPIHLSQRLAFGQSEADFCVALLLTRFWDP